MPRARRSRRIGADQSSVWRVVADPHQLPRWWPKVARVEAVTERQRGTGTLWTKVLKTASGRDVRAEFRCLYSKEPGAFAWEQEVEGSPFQKVFRSSATRIELQPANGETHVTLETEQRLRGMSRLGGFMVRRATGAQLDEALDALESLFGEPRADG